MEYFQFGFDYLKGAGWGSVSRLLTLVGIVTVIIGGSLLAAFKVVNIWGLLAGLGLSLILALSFLHGGFIMYRDERRKRELIAAELESRKETGQTGDCG